MAEHTEQKLHKAGPLSYNSLRTHVAMHSGIHVVENVFHKAEITQILNMLDAAQHN